MDRKKLAQSNPQNDGISPIVSSGDFTGLIPAGGDLNQELEAYNEMYAYIPQADIPEENTP
jgi:hypothetical protein